MWQSQLLTSILITILTLPFAHGHGSNPEPRPSQFKLKDGDVVGILGDSNTELSHFPKLLNQFVKMQLPQDNIQFLPAGRAGSAMSSSVWRVRDSLKPRGVNVLFVMFAINDFNWGLDMNHKKTAYEESYFKAVNEISEICEEPWLRACYFLSYPVTEAPAKSALRDPFFVENPELATIIPGLSEPKGGLFFELGSKLQEAVATANALHKNSKRNYLPVLENTSEILHILQNLYADDPAQRCEPYLHGPDGAHLNEAGSLAVAQAILKSLGAPLILSTATISVSESGDPVVLEESGTKISELKNDQSQLTFERTDERWPLVTNYLANDEWRKAFQLIDQASSMNQARLQIKGLKPGKYQISLNGHTLGTQGVESSILAKGISVYQLNAGYWNSSGPADELSMLSNTLAAAKESLEKFLRYLPDYGNHNLKDSNAYLAMTQELVQKIHELERSSLKTRTVSFVIAPL